MHAVVVGSYSKAVDLYNSATGSWTTAQLSVARCFLAATSVGNVAFFAGGYSGSASLLRNETLMQKLLVIVLDAFVLDLRCYGV
jgi:hypothetical protein